MAIAISRGYLDAGSLWEVKIRLTDNNQPNVKPREQVLIVALPGAFGVESIEDVLRFWYGEEFHCWIHSAVQIADGGAESDDPGAPLPLLLAAVWEEEKAASGEAVA